MSDILEQLENLEYSDRPDFNQSLNEIEIEETPISFEPNEIECKNNTFTFNDIIPLIFKSLTDIYIDFLNGVNIKDCFIKEDRLIGILLIFSIIGIFLIIKNNNNFQ